jgi:hypothetical protein
VLYGSAATFAVNLKLLLCSVETNALHCFRTGLVHLMNVDGRGSRAAGYEPFYG